jgi:glycosyltransferase involved in cell wall biosynthesis
MTPVPRSSEGVLPGVRVAVIHDWLVTYAGAERVLEQILAVFPGAEVFTIVDLLPKNARGFLNGARVHTSFLQKLPVLRRKHRQLLPLMPLAVEQFDVSGFDLVISSSHAVAKGVITGPHQLHICYCHSPIRYAWDLQHEYMRESGMRGPKAWLARYLLHKMRIWDARTSNGVDTFIANSGFIAKRMEKVYRREASVICPPVDVGTFALRANKEDFYLAASRMVPYKRMLLIAEAFAAMPDRRLVMVGDGPEFKKVRDVAGANVEVLGYQSSSVLRDLMQRARAFVFAAEEDFGIAPVEAQACGTPVIAYGRGGALETVIDGETGLFFDAQTVPSIVDAIRRFEDSESSFRPHDIRTHAERFGIEQFRDRFARFVTAEWVRSGRSVAHRAAAISSAA